MKYPKRSQYKYAKSRYRVRNWAEYGAGLQKRGDLTAWLSEAALNALAQGRGNPSSTPSHATTPFNAKDKEDTSEISGPTHQ